MPGRALVVTEEIALAKEVRESLELPFLGLDNNRLAFPMDANRY